MEFSQETYQPSQDNEVTNISAERTTKSRKSGLKSLKRTHSYFSEGGALDSQTTDSQYISSSIHTRPSSTILPKPRTSMSASKSPKLYFSKGIQANETEEDVSVLVARYEDMLQDALAEKLHYREMYLTEEARVRTLEAYINATSNSSGQEYEIPSPEKSQYAFSPSPISRDQDIWQKISAGAPK